MPRGGDNHYLKKIPVNYPLYADAPNIALSVLGSNLTNGFIEKLPDAENQWITRKRPGLSTPFAALSTVYGIQGLWWWDNKQLVVAVCNGVLYTINQQGTVTQLTGATLNTTGRVVFSAANEDGSYFAAANGGNIVCCLGGSTVFAINPTTISSFSGTVSTSGTALTFSDSGDCALCSDGTTITAAGSTCLIVAITGSTTATLASAPLTPWSTTAITSITTFAGAPTAVSHVAYMDGYLLANQVGTAQFYWSAINDFSQWSNSAFTAQYATEESQPQNIMALDAQFDEIRIIGTQSIEYWYNNASSTIAGAPFAKYEGATSMRGTKSPYSFVFANNTHWFLDSYRHLCRLQVRTPQVVSTPFASVLQAIPQVNDAFILPIMSDGKEWLVCIFPSSATSVVYDLRSDSYVGQWSYYNTAIGQFQPWSVSCYCFCPAWGIHLAGDRANGNIYEIGLSYPSDNGNPIRMVKQTGWVDHGHKRRKIASKMRLTLERGVGISGAKPTDTAPLMMYSYRDDGNETWSNEQEVSLGKVGDTYAIGELNRLGKYRSRQHQFAISDAVPLTIVDAEEEGETLLN